MTAWMQSSARRRQEHRIPPAGAGIQREVKDRSAQGTGCGTCGDGPAEGKGVFRDRAELPGDCCKASGAGRKHGKRADADAVTDSREKRAYFPFLWLRQGIVAQRGIKRLFKAVKAVFKAVKKHAVALLRPEGCGQKWKAGKRRLQRTGMTACGSGTYRCFWRFHGRAYQRI